MFCRKCGGKLQPEADFCDSCGSPASTLSRPAPRALSSELDEKPTRSRFIVVLWAFMYSFVGTAVVLFVISSFIDDNLGYQDVSWWLSENLIIISTIVGTFNALTRGVANARRR